jgi:elongation factor 2
MVDPKMIAPYTDEPIAVPYLETFTGSTPIPKLVKSANKLNRIYMTCKSLNNIEDEELKEKLIEISSACFNSNGDLVTEGLPKDIIACVPNNIPGMDYESSCFLVDATKGNEIPAETRKFFSEGFKNAINGGPLINAPIVGGCFFIDRVELASDSVRRGANQLVRPIEDLVRGLLLNSDPSIAEPIYSLDVSVFDSRYSECREMIRSRRGFIENEERSENIVNVTAFIPVAESEGIRKMLEKISPSPSGIGIEFSHYSHMPGSLDDEKSPMRVAVEKIRKRDQVTWRLNAWEYFDDL